MCALNAPSAFLNQKKNNDKPKTDLFNEKCWVFFVDDFHWNSKVQSSPVQSSQAKPMQIVPIYHELISRQCLFSLTPIYRKKRPFEYSKCLIVVILDIFFESRWGSWSCMYVSTATIVSNSVLFQSVNKQNNSDNYDHNDNIQFKTETNQMCDLWCCFFSRFFFLGLIHDIETTENYECV